MATKLIMIGISEALVATAMGLLVAIPSVAAYNYFVRRIRKISLQKGFE
jgi:biopolymer transport protein ExbB